MKLTSTLLTVAVSSLSLSLAACGPGADAGDAGTTVRTGAIAAAGSASQSPASTPSTTTSTCTCTETYRSGRTVSVSSCDGYSEQCADLDLLEECKGRSDGVCDLLDRCVCDCSGLPTPIFSHWAGDGVYLTGIPDLWQFDYMCGQAHPNAIGCGPIAMSMMFYWWAERGFGGLVEDHITSAGLHQWREVAKELRSDYTSGICVPDSFVGADDGEYATFESSLEKTLGDYPGDSGYTHYVRHYRVCDSCEVDGLTDLNTAAGLTVIQTELEAGRPVIMGFNSKQADDTTAVVDGETIYTGNLSVGVGWIDHYAVITGYRRTSDGRDVIYMNMGILDTPPNIPLEWKPAGKWVHLFTLSIPGSPDGAAFCPLDKESVGDTFALWANVGLSHDDKAHSRPTREFEAKAGKACGVARDGKPEIFVPKWTETNDCITLHDIDVLNENINNTSGNLPTGGGGTTPPQTQTPF